MQFIEEETEIVLPAWLSEFAHNVKLGTGFATGQSPDETASVSVSVSPIPTEAMKWIETWKEELQLVFHERVVPAHVWPGMVFDKSIVGYIESVCKIMATFGIHDFQDLHVKSEAINIVCSKSILPDSVQFGFQQVCLSGPLAEEPVRGVVWRIHDMQIDPEHQSSASYATSLACRSAMLAGPVRISEPMLTLEIQTEEIKAAQTVLATRRADIYHSDLVEGSYSEYLIKAMIPASDAFRVGEKTKLTFADELCGATHGKVVWRLAFSHWALLEDSCPIAPAIGVAHKLVCGVRKRKGLTIGEKVVTDSDKQRTLTKMK